MSTLSQKTVVLTGAAGHLGHACIDHFSRAGAKLALLDLKEVKGEHFSIACDLTNAESCAEAVSAIERSLGGIDVLINLAGGFAIGEQVHETSPQTWQGMMAANAEPLLNMVRCVVPGMLERRHGKIVTIGAPAGNHGHALIGAYSASKGAVIRLTEAMAAELGPHGINVNCILPGTIDTPTNRESMPDEDFSNWVAPAAIADVIGFLSCTDSDAVNGAALPVTGLN